MPIGEQLVRDLIAQGVAQGEKLGLEKGRAEGELAKAREALLDVLTARFGRVSDEVRQRVQVTTDTALLKEWLLAVAQADSAAQAEGVVLGTRVP
jgi:predicted transposase YdaD